MADFVVDLEIRTASAEKRIQELEDKLKNVKTAAKQATEDGLEKFTKNGGAMGILNDLTGGLAMKFKDAYNSIQLANTGLKGMKAALLSTGIGALVVAVGAIAANWENIMKFINTSNTGLSTYKTLAEGIRTITKENYDNLVKSENTLKLQGLSEQEILNKKIEGLKLDKGALEFAIAINQMELARLELIEAENKATVEQAGLFGKILGIKYEEKEQTKEVRAALREQKNELVALQGTYDGLILANEELNKPKPPTPAAEIKAEVQKREDIELESMNRITQKQQEANEARRVLMEEQLEATRIASLKTIDITNAEIEAENKSRQDEAELYKKEQDAKVSLAVGTFGALAGLSELFGKGDDARARKAFGVSKALRIAEATAATYQAAIAAYASQLSIPTPDAPVRASIAAGIAVATGLASVANIARTKFGGGGGGGSIGGGASVGAIGSGPQASPPQAALDFSFLNNQQPVQTYVISEDVKTSNEASQKIQDQSKL